MARELTPADVTELADLVAGAVRGAPGRDLGVPAGALEWSVRKTLEHLTASLGKYALYLASRTSRYIPVRLSPMTPEATGEDWLHGLTACARAFASAARAAPPGTRAFHALGMADVEGYLGLACAHLMEHGHDIAAGLGAAFTPPAGVCAAVCARLYPWVTPAAEGPWRTFLWIVEKADLPGRPPVDPTTPPLLAPLAEWDGAVPRSPGFPVAGYVLDAGTGRWTPVPHLD